MISATTLSAVTVAQSGIESLGRILTRGRADASSTAVRLAFTVGTNALVAGVSEGVARALPPREDEPLRRGLLRVAANRTARVAAAGAVLSAVIGVNDVAVEAGPNRRWLTQNPRWRCPPASATRPGASTARTRRPRRPATSPSRTCRR